MYMCECFCMYFCRGSDFITLFRLIEPSPTRFPSSFILAESDELLKYSSLTCDTYDI